jgi:hypothetical protein
MAGVEEAEVMRVEDMAGVICRKNDVRKERQASQLGEGERLNVDYSTAVGD